MKRIEVNSITNVSLVKTFNTTNYNNNFEIVMEKVVNDDVITITGVTDPDFDIDCRPFVRVPIDLIANEAKGGEYIVRVYCESVTEGMTLVSSLLIDVVSDDIVSVNAGDPIYGNVIKANEL
jgi:hypothetical protein